MNLTPQSAKVEPIAAASGPVELAGGSATAELMPASTEQGRKLGARLGSLASNERIFLVLRDLVTQEQPGVVYQVFLDLPAGSTPGKDDPRYVGVTNFYGAAKAQGPEASSSSAFRSFDVTDVLRNLQRQNQLADRVTVTIVPAGAVPNAVAKPVIGKIELVVQKE
jgi:tyrosinase